MNTIDQEEQNNPPMPNICFRCFSSFDVPLENAGREVQCPSCGMLLQAKGSSPEITPADPASDAKYREFVKHIRIAALILALLILGLLIAIYTLGSP